MYYQNHKNIYGEIEVIYLISNQYFYVIKSDFASVPGFALLERGFTGHEHILQFGIINMNARLYDPIIASFLSPDNEVTDPENPQNYNRFSYALNNPLRYTDPSGNNPLLVAWIFSTIVQAGATWQSQGFNQALVSCLVNSTISLALSNISGVFPQYASGSWESLAVHISKTMSSNLISGMLTGGKYTGQAAVLSITSSIMSWGTEAALASSSMNEAASRMIGEDFDYDAAIDDLAHSTWGRVNSESRKTISDRWHQDQSEYNGEAHETRFSIYEVEGEQEVVFQKSKSVKFEEITRKRGLIVEFDDKDMSSFSYSKGGRIVNVAGAKDLILKGHLHPELFLINSIKTSFSGAVGRKSVRLRGSTPSSVDFDNNAGEISYIYSHFHFNGRLQTDVTYYINLGKRIGGRID